MNRNEFYSALSDYNDEHSIKHYGTKGQKWGVRHWQNADGTFNEAGKKRYFGVKYGSAKKSNPLMSSEDTSRLDSLRTKRGGSYRALPYEEEMEYQKLEKMESVAKMWDKAKDNSDFLKEKGFRVYELPDNEDDFQAQRFYAEDEHNNRILIKEGYREPSDSVEEDYNNYKNRDKFLKTKEFKSAVDELAREAERYESGTDWYDEMIKQIKDSANNTEKLYCTFKNGGVVVDGLEDVSGYYFLYYDKDSKKWKIGVY